MDCFIHQYTLAIANPHRCGSDHFNLTLSSLDRDLYIHVSFQLLTALSRSLFITGVLLHNDSAIIMSCAKLIFFISFDASIL